MVVEHAHGLRQRRGPNAKSSLHKAHLAPDAGLQAPGASLSFAQGSHDFESLDRGIGRGDRFETAHRLDQYLELSVIGLDHVIEILHLPVGRLPVQLSFALQFGDRCTIARRFVGIERGRLFPVLQASQGLAQEPLRCLGAAGRRQVEIDRVAPLVDCPVQVGPLAPHLDVGFIQAPARIKATPPEPAQPLLHLRGVALDPAIDRRMVDRNAAFRQHFLKVAIADRIATIPAHRPQDHITLEMAPLEIRHRSVRPISAKHAQASRFLQQSHNIYDDLASGGRDDRPGLTACLKSLRDGDVLVVWKLDRLGRSLAHLVNTVKELSDRKIGLRVLTGKGAQIDTTTASGRMVFGIFATLAEFERDLIRERTMAGLASARARGRKGGRKFALTKAQVRLAQAAMAQRDTSVSDLCKELGIERVTLYRYVGPKGELRDHGKHVLGLT